MHVVIFQAVVKELDEEYVRTAGAYAGAGGGDVWVRALRIRPGGRSGSDSVVLELRGRHLPWRAHPEHRKA